MELVSSFSRENFSSLITPTIDCRIALLSHVMHNTAFGLQLNKWGFVLFPLLFITTRKKLLDNFT